MSKETEELDYLIVGQGLAGTLLSFFLFQKNQRVKVLDYPHPGTSSKVAAGIVNPVTGRRIAMSWRFDTFFPHARDTYRKLEDLLGIPLWKDRPIARALHNTFEANEWERRAAFPEFQNYIGDIADGPVFDKKIKQPHAWGMIHGTAQVDLPALLSAYRQWLENQGLFISENFDHRLVETQETGATYRHFTAKKIIFCEGARARENPFFRYLPFAVTKGELLLVRIPGAGFDKMIKHKIFIVPLEARGCDLYWAGPTSRWEFDGPEPTVEYRTWLTAQLDAILDMPYQVVEHLAGIRPTVEDKRPFLGLHPQYPALAMFNGLGTKGALLGPFHAEQMAEFLLDHAALDVEVDIGRVLSVKS